MTTSAEPFAKTAPRLLDVAPELATELQQLLLQEGEQLLAAQVDELAIID